MDKRQSRSVMRHATQVFFVVKFREPIGALGLIDRFTDAYWSTCFGQGFSVCSQVFEQYCLAQFLLLKSLCDHSVVHVDSCGTLVLPLTVEPAKPRLCLDTSFLNLWMTGAPFTLDRLADVPQYVYKGSYMTKCEDKSGYDHVSLSLSLQCWLPVEWILVCLHYITFWMENLPVYIP